VSVAYSPNRFSQIAQNSQSPEKILLYDKGNAPGGLVQHAPKLPPHTRKTFRWLAEGQPQLERCRFGRVSFARQLVELGQSRPVAGVRLAFSQPGILAVTGPGALPQATVSLAFGQKTGDAEPCAKTCPITADVRSPSTTSIQKNRTVLLSAGDTGGRLSGGAGRIRLEPAAGRGSADGGTVPPDPNCAWHLLSDSVLLAEGQLHRSLGQRPRWGGGGNTPQPTTSHPNIFLRLAEGQPQPDVAMLKGPCCSNRLTSAEELAD
jgi:hypothetical protein